MMNKDQRETVKLVYQRFVESDGLDQAWSDLDEQMSLLEWLDDGQLIIEASVKIKEQTMGQPRCNQNHSIGDCFVPTIIEAVGLILDLYSKTGNLHSNNKFIVKYYLALSQVGFIIY